MAMDNRLVEWIKLQIPAGDDYVVISYDETDMFYAAMVTECRLASLIEPAVINTPDGIMTYRLTDIGKIALGIQDPATEPLATPPTGAREAIGDDYLSEWDAIYLEPFRASEVTVPVKNVKLTTRQEEILRHLWSIDSSGWWDAMDNRYAENREQTRILMDGGLVQGLPHGRFIITERGRAWIDTHTHISPATVSTGDGAYYSSGNKLYRSDGGIIAFSQNAEDYARIVNQETAALRSELAAARERIAELTGELPSGRNDSIELSNDVAATDKLLAESEAMITKLTAENNRLQEAIESAYDHACTASKELGYGNDEIAQEYILKTKAVLGEIVLSDD